MKQFSVGRCGILAVPLLLLAWLGCAEAPSNTAITSSTTRAVTATELLDTPYRLYNPEAKSTPTAPATGKVDPMPEWIGTRTPSGRKQPKLEPPPVSEEYLARRKRYSEELPLGQAEWAAEGLSEAEMDGRQAELKRSILGH